LPARLFAGRICVIRPKYVLLGFGGDQPMGAAGFWYAAVTSFAQALPACGLAAHTWRPNIHAPPGMAPQYFFNKSLGNNFIASEFLPQPKEPFLGIPCVAKSVAARFADLGNAVP
ncbi:MAG: hypothetical protein M3Q00_08765, partial [Pseudomonadota bacterium]|nr:hypothetical protein [Pseudomonadota bacterium]